MNKIIEILMKLLKSNSLPNDVASELADAIKSVESKSIDDAHEEKIDTVLSMAPDTFLSEAIVELRDLGRGAKRKRARELASDATLFEVQAKLENDKYAMNKWGEIQFKLHRLR